MTGFDAPRATDVSAIPAGFQLEVAVAIGQLSDAYALLEKLRAGSAERSQGTR
jgi:hypothetical protein